MPMTLRKEAAKSFKKQNFVVHKPRACTKKDLEPNIQYLLTERYIRLQPHLLIKEVRNLFPDRRPTEIKAAIKDMMTAGLLTYSNVFSSTFIIWNHRNDLKVSPWSPHDL